MAGRSGLLLTLETALKETWPNTEIRPNNYLFDAAVKRRTVLVVMLWQGVSRGRKVMVFDTMENHGLLRQTVVQCELPQGQQSSKCVGRRAARHFEFLFDLTYLIPMQIVQ